MPADVPLPPLVEKLLRREDLTEDEASGAMHTVMAGRATPAALAGPAGRAGDEGRAAARDRGLRADDARARREAVGARRSGVRHLRHRRRRGRHVQHLLRGRPGRGGHAASRVAKHGNRSVSSRCGSADVFEALGVHVAAEPAVVERTLREAGVAFFFAPTFHPSMKHAGADAPRPRHPQRVQPAGPADQPARAPRARLSACRSPS